ncbi:MAG: hypothetical protein U1F35_05445 [Steroidobacteraceae bacterium]
MPAIPVYDQQTNLSGTSLGPGPVNTTSNGIGEGLQQVAQGAQHLVRAQDQIKEANAASWSAQALTQSQSDWLTTLDERKRSAPAGAPNFTKDLLSDFDKNANETIGMAPTAASKKFMTERLTALRGQLTRSGLEFENVQRTANNIDIAKTSVDAARGELQNQPDYFAVRLAERRELINQMDLTGKEMEKLLDYAQRSMAHDATVGLIDRNPYTALKAINSKGPSGVAAVDALNPDDRLVLRNAAEGEIHRRELVARQNQDRADAIGYRAVSEMDRQVASGLPATAQMWADWQADVKGTQYEPMFKERLAAEQEVQGVLRKPIAEQVAYVQQQQAKLEAEGGDLQELANLNRLQGAIKQNANMLMQTPLQYAQVRLGQQVAPVDFSALADPQGASSLAPQFAARAATVEGLRKSMGDQVGYKLLLPQEAAQLAAVVENATPKQATQIFASLRTAAGSDQAYTSMMQQIAPDSPVRSFAGLIASKKAQLTLQSHIFSPDIVAQSGDVAATMLRGEALLDPSKQAKGADGKPRTSLYLPETKTLQAAFQDQVGSAFAGYPNAAQIAFQAVNAYYTGKAADTGRLAADSKDIDSDLVKEAITATIGQVVDYNGRGDVIAPWGMDENQFTSAVQRAFAAQKGSINWQDNQPKALDALGLKPAGSGSYYLTAGRGYLTDKTGAPVVLKLGDPIDYSAPPPIPQEPRVGRGVDR